MPGSAGRPASSSNSSAPIPVIILMLFAFELWFFVFDSPARSPPSSSAWSCTTARCWPRSSGPGILAVPRGQTEAALAIGLNKTQLMTIVLLPQAVTTMLPAVVSQLVVIVKDTALGGILVGYVELRRARQHLRQQLRQPAADLRRGRGHLHHHQHAAELAVHLPGTQAANQARRAAGGDHPGRRRNRPAGAPGDHRLDAPGVDEFNK